MNTWRTKTGTSAGFGFFWEQIKSVEGMKIKVERGADEIEWKVVDKVTNYFVKDDGFCIVKPEYNFYTKELADAFILLWPGNLC